jgi:hypothetical protein
MIEMGYSLSSCSLIEKYFEIRIERSCFASPCRYLLTNLGKAYSLAFGHIIQKSHVTILLGDVVGLYWVLSPSPKWSLNKVFECDRALKMGAKNLVLLTKPCHSLSITIEISSARRICISLIREADFKLLAS